MIITNDTSDDLSFIREFNYPEKMEGLAIIELPDCKLALSVCYSLPLKSGNLLKIMIVFPNPSDENFEFRDYYENKGGFDYYPIKNILPSFGKNIDQDKISYWNLWHQYFK